MAYKFSVAAVDALRSGQTNAIMTYKDGSFGTIPIDQVAGARYKIDSDLVKLCAPLSC
jgi:hypothetical protein